MPSNPFPFLKQTVNILLVDDSPLITSWISGMLELLDLYYISVASSTAEAVTILETGEKRYHVCVVDLGMSDVENNEFYLMDNYGKKMPFIVITARSDTERGFKCGSRGVKEILLKDSRDFERRLLSTINKYALKSIICPKFCENPSTTLIRFIECLDQKKPASVNEWVAYLKMDERYFRSEWEKYVGMMPKHSLCIFYLFSETFKYIEKVNIKGSIAKADSDILELIKKLDASSCFKRCKEYFLQNEQILKDFISKRY
jgi:CheY-like chemotaxis protein